MIKQEIVQKISESIEPQGNKSKNSMGVSESFYDPYYLIGMCFTKGKKLQISETPLIKMSEEELTNLFKLAEYASDVFY